MKPLRKFFMEEDLETNRFHAKFNLGESGGHAQTVFQLLRGSGLEYSDILNGFGETKLCDSPNWGREDLRKIIAQMHPGATIDNVLITTGTSEALFLLFRYLNPKSVALPLPAFQLLYELPLAMRAKIIPLPIYWDEQGSPFYLEEEWLNTLQKKKPDCILINHPHNPSGLVFPLELLKKIQTVADRTGSTLVGDEHYRFLSSESEILGNTLYQNHPRTFVTGSFIKCFGAPGLRIGWCVGPKKALSAMQNEKNYTTHTVNPITEWISYEVLKNFQSSLFQKIKSDWLQNKSILKEFLKKKSSIYGAEPQGGLVTSCGFSSCCTKKQASEKILKLKENGVFLLPLEAMEFGQFDFQKQKSVGEKKLSPLNRGVGFRLGLGCEPSHFEKALELIGRV